MFVYWHNFRPSLAVVPKSLIFNSKQGAARFSPRLRVLDHTGNQRLKGVAHFEDYDLVLTTYGTLRNDAADFKDLRFDYLILDEAQAIKNADSVSAKSARLLVEPGSRSAGHRPVRQSGPDRRCLAGSQLSFLLLLLVNVGKVTGINLHQPVERDILA